MMADPCRLSDNRRYNAVRPLTLIAEPRRAGLAEPSRRARPKQADYVHMG